MRRKGICFCMVFIMLFGLLAPAGQFVSIVKASVDEKRAFLQEIEHKTQVPAGYTAIWTAEDMLAIE